MMLARPLARCRRQPVPLSGIRRVGCRRFSSATSANSGPHNPVASSSPPNVLAGLTSELDRIAPRFDIEASQVQIIRTPSQFYETLKTKILNARHRIFLSTLYIGKTEHDLISTIRQALLNQPELKVSFLTDALRGTRETPNPSCASLLAPLVTEFGPDRVEIRMYHTPNLTGIRKRYIPRRINEGWGLQHMKLYGVDDEIILSGANLSTDYFTNRQDRYHVFSSKEVTFYFGQIHDAVSSLSFRVQPRPDEPAGYKLEWPESNAAPSPLEEPKAFVSAAGARVHPLIQPATATTKQSELLPPTSSSSSSSSPSSKTTDTIIYPLSQFTPLLNPDTSTEKPGLATVLRHLASSALANSSWTFTAGYFNITPEFKNLLLASNPARGTVVTASPWANGFYGSKGVSGMLPPAYTLLARRFLESVIRAERQKHPADKSNHIELKEWRLGTVGQPGGWTYHAKGLWITLPESDSERQQGTTAVSEPSEPKGVAEEQTPKEQPPSGSGPSISLIGSSNYTKRSYTLDLEANVLIVTTNPQLKQRLGEEEAWLQEHARAVDLDEFTRTERRVSWRVRVAMWIVTALGGAL
ncbi:CDP-diacylglycerol-glycerol-3-phosphate 3-phosphatidyltransferase [Xylona heveae TC161]|uniref:CDP-diacylglycerol--glycerol-3-phosphate 3-phosphatidyltransferase n=1 Tax=Xylona heveae (strain CBS 132557 / TC161) TaxID=1328760 RepID=A0A164ZJE1_XYLHT|nr:CDP-diacylglycerol-glycerol-3-phosphate 3-phosphatidyltransferase [Xylona heveae TC161]KZF19172.1 CDP-diacylglycerol-glycerol-3-phosphate 3-phosphatidyltransferase [Xylona heveae TC161]